MESLNNPLINQEKPVTDVEYFLSKQLKESQIIQDQIYTLISKVTSRQELKRAFLDQHIKQLNLPRRVYVGLLLNSINTIDDLTNLTSKKLLKLPMIGHTAIAEIQKGLQKVGMTLT